MRRWPTWLVVGALVALAAVALADALRGGGTTVRVRLRIATVPLIPGNEPAASAMNGVLYYSDTKDECRIHGLVLPGLGDAPSPKLRSCRFSLSPDGQTALPGQAEWSPQGGLYAREATNMIELGSRFSHQTLRFPGHAPTFKPDGTFTYVRDNKLVEWTTDCPPRSQRFTLTGDNTTARCRRIVLSTAGLREALAGVDSSGPLTLKDLTWLSNTRLITVVGDAGISGYQEHLSVIDGRRVVGPRIGELGEGLRVEASPHGNFFTAWIGDSLVTVRDREGDLISFPPLPRVEAVTWSPDERWTAVSTEHSVFVFRTNEGEARVRRLPIAARDLAWR